VTVAVVLSSFSMSAIATAEDQGGGIDCKISTPDANGWYGKAPLRTKLPRGAYLVSLDRSRKRYIMKIPWERGVAGRLRVTATRLAGVGTARVEMHPRGYLAIGMLPINIRFSSLGCWKITASLRDHRLNVVVLLKDQDSGQIDSTT
jgi:hypothetical protein